jgi:hypothetical protein
MPCSFSGVLGVEAGGGAPRAGYIDTVLVGVGPFVVNEEGVADAPADAFLDVGDAADDSEAIADVNRGEHPVLVGGDEIALRGVG